MVIKYHVPWLQFGCHIGQLACERFLSFLIFFGNRRGYILYLLDFEVYSPFVKNVDCAAELRPLLLIKLLRATLVGSLPPSQCSAWYVTMIKILFFP